MQRISLLTKMLGSAYLHQITAVTNSKTAMRQTLTHAMNNQSDDKPAFPYRLWPYLRFYRREEFRFAVKVGGGAALYAMFSYIPATQEFYNHWKMDWGLAACKHNMTQRIRNILTTS